MARIKLFAVVPAPNRNEISRRDFIKVTVAGIGTLIGALIGIPSMAYLLSPVLRAQAEDEAFIPLGPLESYPIGIPTRFELTRTKINSWERTATNYGLFVVRRNEDQVRIFSDICTHLGCRVSWHPDLEHDVSPCHDGHFDIMGRNISGPPPRPLDEFFTKIENGDLFVVLPPFQRFR